MATELRRRAKVAAVTYFRHAVYLTSVVRSLSSQPQNKGTPHDFIA
jgi:hypothetical protein